MKAMILEKPGQPLRLVEREVPSPSANQVLIEVSVCGVCRTDLHVVDGELKDAKLPLVPGHEIVGRVVATGPGAGRFKVDDRVGVPWLGHTCRQCRYCTSGQENLCDRPQFTGYTLDGGYADFAVADEDFCFPLPDNYSDLKIAPLLCAGLIGYRSLVMAGDAQALGLYGFGAAAHIIAQVAVQQGRRVYAFTRPGDRQAQKFSSDLGVVWAGDSGTKPPEDLDAAILYAPVGALVPVALRAVRKGGRVICAGIHMSDIPSFPYRILWGERHLRSVANLTRRDGEEFFRIAGQMALETKVHPYTLVRANEALDDLRHGRFQGAAVLITEH